MGEGVSGFLQGHCRIGGFGSQGEAFAGGRERKCEGDGSRAALPLSLPLVALQVQKIWGLRQQVDIVRRLWYDNRKDVWYGK